MPDQHVMTAAMQAHVDRANAGDADGLLALFAPDTRMEDPVGTPPRDRAAMVTPFRDGIGHGAWVDLTGAPRGSHGSEAAIAFDVRLTPPGGVRPRVSPVDPCTLREDGRITGLRGFQGPDDVSGDPVSNE